MSQSPDEELLAWVADEGLILLTHDAQTLVNGAYTCVKEGLSVLGVIEVLQDTRIVGAAVIEDNRRVARCTRLLERLCRLRQMA